MVRIEGDGPKDTLKRHKYILPRSSLGAGDHGLSCCLVLRSAVGLTAPASALTKTGLAHNREGEVPHAQHFFYLANCRNLAPRYFGCSAFLLLLGCQPMQCENLRE